MVAATHSSLDRSVVARYADVVVDLDQHPTGTVMLINATPATRVVIRTGRAITGGETRAPDTSVITQLRPVPAGLVELELPGFGSATITLPS